MPPAMRLERTDIEMFPLLRRNGEQIRLMLVTISIEPRSAFSSL